MIDGDANAVFRDAISLSSPFERNLDVLKVNYGEEAE
jgi:hypothetical protein